MKIQTIFLVALVASLMLTPAFAKNPVCKTAKKKPMPGGWQLLTRKEIKSTPAIKANAKELAQARAASTGCSYKNLAIVKACEQASTNPPGFEYKAVMKMYNCPGNPSKANVVFTNKF